MSGNQLNGKVALVTGGGRGIGRAIAMRLAAEGAAVAICSRTERELKETVREITRRNGEARLSSRQASYRVVDLASAAAIRSLVRNLRRRYFKIDILVNNASLLGPRRPIAEYPFKDWEAVLKVNLTAPFLLAQEVLRLMIPQESGCILNITSSVGRRGRAQWGGYSVSKFGLEGLTQILAEELREHRIRVLALNPGGTRTAMRAAAYPEEDPGRLPPPDAVAQVALDLLLQDDMALSGQSFDARSFMKAPAERPPA
ncbi:MAG: SDR family NAD(P)-dependent oxidoreductase [Nitrospirae bacterium]|nr:SDR family NAD(P)-dependent oxidoreductase [Nitrospirota bacterium]